MELNKVLNDMNSEEIRTENPNMTEIRWTAKSSNHPVYYFKHESQEWGLLYDSDDSGVDFDDFETLQNVRFYPILLQFYFSGKAKNF